MIANAADSAKFGDVPGRLRRGSCVGDAAGGLGVLPATRTRSRTAGRAQPGTAPQRPAAAVLHLGHDGQPKLVEHTQVSYPVGHLSTMYWIGLRPGDVHLNITSPGWAKHAWSCFFAPWIAEADGLRLQLRAGSTPAPCWRQIRRARGDDVLRAADGVADADPGRPDRRARPRCARWSARASR